MVRPSIRHRELHLNRGICRPTSVKCSRTRSSVASAASRSPAFSAPAKTASIFHNFSRNRIRIDIGRARLNLEPCRASRSIPFTVREQTIAIRKPPQLDAYGSYATTRSGSTSFTPWVLVAMGGNLIRRNTPPGFLEQTLRCAVASVVWFPTMSDMQRYSGRAIVVS